MKRSIHRMVLIAFCALGAQNVYTEPTVIVIDGSKQLENKKASRTERLKELAQEIGHDVSNGAKALVVGASLWSAGRHYQMVKDSDNDWKALFAHKDSLSVWLWTYYRPLCVTVAALGSSYFGYKMYRYFANKKAQTPKAGMVDSETQTSLLI